MEKDIAICIQVRTRSERLKNKCFRKIKNKFLLEYCYKRLIKIEPSIPAYILTSNLKSDDKIAKFCKKNKINLFRGDHDDVLNRYASFIKKTNIKNIIRGTSDNIFTDIVQAKKLIKNHINNKNDYSSNHYSYLPKGMGIDIFKASTLLKLNKMNLNKSAREHINMFFLKNKRKFKIFLKKGKNKNKINLSIDTKKDLQFIKKNFENLKKINSYSELKKILSNINHV